MQKLAANAQYFEDRAPWAQQYKKQGVKPPMAKACETIIETGDFHVSTVGDNLPNENQIREKYGSKSFLLTGSSRTLRQATGFGALEEFAASPEEIALSKKYGEEASDLLTALHEIIGHGSGKLNPKLKGGSESYLKEYFSTLEEARADLMALWNISDPKLRELGLVSSPEVAKAMYYEAVRTVLTQLMRIPKGDTIEEDHQRNRQLIVNYIMDKTGAIQKVERNGKTYLAVKDVARMQGRRRHAAQRADAHQGRGRLRCHQGAGGQIRRALRPETARPGGAALRQAQCPHLLGRHQLGADREIRRRGQGIRGDISYPRDYVKQQLGYAAMYGLQ